MFFNGNFDLGNGIRGKISNKVDINGNIAGDADSFLIGSFLGKRGVATFCFGEGGGGG